MGDHIIDIIIFAMVALFFVVQLWRVLGQRTGSERPPSLPTATERVAAPPQNVVPLPQRVLPSTSTADPVEAGLQAIREADPGFQPAEFVAGARHAFELIVQAFAAGDTPTLRPLVSDDVFDTFAEAVRHRLQSKETVETRIVRLAEPVIAEARLDGRTAFVTVRYVSAQISVTRSADGAVVEGDPVEAIDRTDFWTYSRNTRASDPNWILVATGAPE
jgi:predicted lipid-binding transport protein (Tim44 family)